MGKIETLSKFESHFYNTSMSNEITSPNINVSSSDGVLEEWDWEEAPFVFPTGFQVAAHILYNIVMVLGLIGNGCVLLIFLLRHRPFRKLPTPLLANLAVGDLLITIFNLETSYLTLLWQYWPFGKFMCHALSPVKPIAVFVSCYTLIALSVDRYLTVQNPMKTGVLSKEKVRWTVGIIWILAVCTSLPTGLFTGYEINLRSGLPRCDEYAWESEMKEMIYDIALISLQFFAPLLVLIYTYTRISIVVFKNRAVRHRMTHGTSPRQKSHRTVRMSLMVVLGYTLAWLPYNVVALLAKNHRALGESDHFPYIFVACHWLAMSHSVYNPIIYFWLNDSFRTTVLELFCRKRAIERRRTSSTLVSWRTSTMFTSSRRSSSIRRPSSKLKQQKSPSESSSYPGTPLIKIPTTPNDRINDRMEEKINSILNGENGHLSKKNSTDDKK